MEIDAVQRRKKWNKKPQKGKPFVKKDESMKKNLCFKCGQSGHQAAACRGRQQVNALEGDPFEGQSRPPSLADPGDDWMVEQPTAIGEWDNSENSGWDRPQTPILQAPVPHKNLSWTGCYEDNCQTHASDKDATGWYPKKSKSNHVPTEAPFAP
jgi:Zinc knuckle